MDIFIIILLIIGSVILFLVELFIVPGISIAGILAGVCAIFANYYAFAHVGITAGIVTLLVTAVVCIGAIVWFMRSKTLDRISLKQNITSKVNRNADVHIRQGDTGITTTRLALIGYADFGGNIVEVKSTGELLDEHTPVRVIRIMDGSILVEKLNPAKQSDNINQ